MGQFELFGITIEGECVHDSFPATELLINRARTVAT